MSGLLISGCGTVLDLARLVMGLAHRRLTGSGMSEFRRLELPSERGYLEGHVNELGLSGWEVICVFPHVRPKYEIVYLRRSFATRFIAFIRRLFCTRR